VTPPRRRRRLRALLALAAAAPLVLPGGATAGATTATEPAPPAPPASAPATAPPAPGGGLPLDRPLRSGFTPQSVAAAVVPGPDPTPPAVGAAGAVLFDPADGVVLAEVDARSARPMASLTKIMTVLLALEALEAGRVAGTLTVSPEAAATGQLPGVATLGLRAGDVVDLRAVLAGELLRSGNDGAVAVAEHVAGSEAAYVALMDQRAAGLGLEDTGFVDASGLSDDPAHRATPLDLALLAEEAMRHPDFAAWAGADILEVAPFGLLENRNELLGTYPGTTGVKTGFTELAGQCLVASAERDGRTLYAVVLGSEDRVADATALLDHGFEDHARPTPLRPGDVAATYRTAAGDVPLSPPEDLARTVGAGAAVEVRTTLAPDAALPLDVGAPLGEAQLLVDGEVVDAVPLLADVPLAEPAAGVGGALADALRAYARLAPRRAPVPL
jgi:serine-type D-Ala-D-Ala carboxypeptidase (penicillin-binding protein 5/6)